MYRFSRSIYRELAPRVVEDEWDPTGCANKQKVLDACEGAIRRLTYDRRYFAKPARTLFTDVRMHFAVGDQLFVWTVIERNLNLALEFLERLPEGVGLDGRPPECQAHTPGGGAGAGPDQVEAFAHGMTVGTTARREERGARTALAATEGFTAVLDIARQSRPDLYRLCAPKPAALVPDEVRFALRERTGAEGVVEPLADGELDRLAGVGRASEGESGAVCLLFSSVDPAPEPAGR